MHLYFGSCEIFTMHFFTHVNVYYSHYFILTGLFSQFWVSWTFSLKIYIHCYCLKCFDSLWSINTHLWFSFSWLSFQWNQENDHYTRRWTFSDRIYTKNQDSVHQYRTSGTDFLDIYGVQAILLFKICNCWNWPVPSNMFKFINIEYFWFGHLPCATPHQQRAL